jgi:hypothetical protein
LKSELNPKFTALHFRPSFFKASSRIASRVLRQRNGHPS